MSNDTLPEWMHLQALAKKMQATHLRDLIQSDAGRFNAFTASIPGLFSDFTRARINHDVLGGLFSLVRAADVAGWRDRMFSGEKINTTENRAVLHTALRRPAGDSVSVDGHNVIPDIQNVLNRMQSFVESIHSGTKKGYTGKPINRIISIGIGGSDLGPRMVVDALWPYHVPGMSVRFVSNVDGSHLYRELGDADPETTLFLIASKTFTTQETMTNAHTAREWLVGKLGDRASVYCHFAALSTNTEAVQDFGIDPELMFPFWDWVGGRYSLWSAIGLSIALAVGFDHFRALLNGAYNMDQHFLNAAPDKNLPMILGALRVWERSFMGTSSHVVIPYDQHLALLPSWLQQTDMESNGKSVTRSGQPAGCETAPALFGVPGTDCQHSFFQMMHQGTSVIPTDFIAAIEPAHPWPEHHRMLLANMLAQADALAFGRSLEDSGNDPHRAYPGNRPSTILLLDRLDPEHLGMLLALYEHSIFVQGILWDINSFDQFGVELGKTVANQSLKLLLPQGSAPEGTLAGLIRKRLSP